MRAFPARHRDARPDPVAAPARESPVYRPFALLAFGATLIVGTPLGIAMLAWLYLGTAALPIEGVLLHAHVQVFGFLATLIPGVAPHLFARFTGRALGRDRIAPWLAAGLGLGLAARVAGAWWAVPGITAAGALVQAIVFTVFGLQVWRALDPAPLAMLRVQLTAATGWLALACLAEAWLRWRALRIGLVVPEVGALRAVHTMGIFGGVLGWVLGVLLRAGPMFVAGWRIPLPVARAVPALLGLGVALTVMGEAGGLEAGLLLARGGEFVALLAPAAMIVASGAFRRARRPGLPMLVRSAREARIFRIAAVSAVAAVALSAATGVMAALGEPVRVLADAVRHLLTVGVLTSVVTAMTFRLIPVLEGCPLPWPGARAVAFWALLAAVVLRIAEVAVSLGWMALAPAVALSGPGVWVALAAVAGSLVTAIVTPPRLDRSPRGGSFAPRE
jgi:hypothetical protein